MTGLFQLSSDARGSWSSSNLIIIRTSLAFGPELAAYILREVQANLTDIIWYFDAIHILVKCSNAFILFNIKIKPTKIQVSRFELWFKARFPLFYRKSMEWVMEIIRLWPDFSKVAKHGFKEFSWWKGFLFTCSYRPYMFSFRKITRWTWFVVKRFAKTLYKTCKNEF